MKHHIKHALILTLAAGVLLVTGCGKQANKASYQGESNQIAKVIAQRNLTPNDVLGAVSTYEPSGQHDEYVMFASGDQSGQVLVYGIPSMRLLDQIPVFTPDSMAGWGYGGAGNAILRDADLSAAGSRGPAMQIRWGDTHHPALSQTNGKYDGKYLFINDKANGRVAVALWGDNGAGKSTTIKCIVGLLDYSGNITAAGQDAKANGKAARRLIGYVPQELRFYNDWSVRRTMAFYADLKRAGREEIPNLLREVGLEAQACKAVSALSGGMKQRLALAIALLGQPEALLLDEFTASLDAEARAGLLNILKELRRKGLTVVFTTHRFDEVEALADRVEMMHSGKIMASVPVEDFLQRIGVRSAMHAKEPDRASEMEPVLQEFCADAHDNCEALRPPAFSNELVGKAEF